MDELTQAGINNTRIIKAYGELPSVKAAVYKPGGKIPGSQENLLKEDQAFLVNKCIELEDEVETQREEVGQWKRKWDVESKHHNTALDEVMKLLAEVERLRGRIEDAYRTGFRNGLDNETWEDPGWEEYNAALDPPATPTSPE